MFEEALHPPKLGKAGEIGAAGASNFEHVLSGA